MGLPEGSWRYWLEIAAGYWLAAVLVLLELAVGSCRLGIGGWVLPVGYWRYWLAISVLGIHEQRCDSLPGTQKDRQKQP